MFDLTAILLPFVKTMVLVLQGIHVLFAFMLTSQVKIMNKNFRTGLAGFFGFLAFIHLIAAISFLVLTYLFS